MQDVISKQQVIQTQPVLPQEQPLDLEKRMINKKKISILVAVIVIVLVLIVVFVVSRKDRIPLQEQITSSSSVVTTVSPTPEPFAALTIPYLRSRSYQSALGKKTKIAATTTYDTYLTSYQSDGLIINALLTRPTSAIPEGGYPAIVFVHGYIPPTQYKTTERYGDYVDYLAKNGFVVLKIDLRGHGESEGEPSGAYFSSGYIIDTLNAYAALQSADFVNPKKIGLWGHSMAGNIVMRSAVAMPSIPAVVVWAGAVYTYTDLQEYRINDASYQPAPNASARNKNRQLLFDTYGQPSSTSAFWKKVAVTDYLKDFTGAVQIHHAVNDDVVNIGYSRGLTALLDKTSVPHELYEYPSGGHNIEGISFVQAMNRTVDFFKKYLYQ